MPGRAGVHFSMYFPVLGDPSRGFWGPIRGFLNGIWAGLEIVWAWGRGPSFSCFPLFFPISTHLGGRQTAPNASLGG